MNWIHSALNFNQQLRNTYIINQTGPELWYEHYPISLIGQRQSPINIITEDCVLNNRDLVLKELEIEYPPLFNGLILKNPRDIFYGWRVDVPFNEADKTRMKLIIIIIFIHITSEKDLYCSQFLLTYNLIDILIF
jgi:carbonic anhydrase